MQRDQRSRFSQRVVHCRFLQAVDVVCSNVNTLKLAYRGSFSIYVAATFHKMCVCECMRACKRGSGVCGGCVCVCVCACVRACVRACARACVRACVCVCVRVRASDMIQVILNFQNFFNCNFFFNHSRNPP